MGGVMDRWRWQRGQTCHSEVKKRGWTDGRGGTQHWGERRGWTSARMEIFSSECGWKLAGPDLERAAGRRDISRRLRSKERRLRDRWRTVPSPPSTSFYLHRWVWKAYSTILAISTANKHIHTHSYKHTKANSFTHTWRRIYTHKCLCVHTCVYSQTVRLIDNHTPYVPIHTHLKYIQHIHICIA